MELVIVTGISGAGKSKAITALEDIGYYCIDNLPPALIPNFVQLCRSSGNISKVSIVTDSRGGEFFQEFQSALDELSSLNCKYSILYLEATKEVLEKRFKETRRKHPLLDSSNGSIEDAIELDLSMVDEFRGKADYIIDTSQLSNAQLKERITSLFSDNPNHAMNVVCMSFGFKFGPASEADLMFDVRCLPNPFYIDELKFKTGLDKEVRDYVLGNDSAKELLTKLEDLIDFLSPLYQKEGKSSLVIAVGCTGGKHRSVTFADALYKHLSDKGIKASINHRDIEKHI